ncbi:MAG: hypothetical protein ACW99Q_13530, partial [Candidatus Kariarchaeaceae archaeon]
MQPDIADLNSHFEVFITTRLGTEENTFGILLPIGWTVKDSIQWNGTNMGSWQYSKTLSDSVEKVEPAPNGYYWWVSFSDHTISSPDTIYFVPQIKTDNQSGTFFISYILGINGIQRWVSFFDLVSSGHPISVNAPMNLIVSNTNDGGIGSLRQALIDISSGGNITFDLPNHSTILLDSCLVIDRNITLTGLENDEFTISGNNKDRIFLIGVNNLIEGYWNGLFELSVSISNLNISDGHVEGQHDSGGGIHCSESLNLSNVNITNNFAGAAGGGIYWVGSTELHLNNVSLMNNSTQYGHGGGIYIHVSQEGTVVSLENVVIANNTGDYGGGFHAWTDTQKEGGWKIGPRISFVNVTIANNSAAQDLVSGGVHVGLGFHYFSMVNTIICGNSPQEISATNWNNVLTKPFIVAYSDIIGGVESNFSPSDVIWLDGNIDAYPMFVDSANSD